MKETVVITGAGSGLGASLARKFSSLGSHVCLIGRTQEKLLETASKLENDYSIFEADVTSRVSVRNTIRKIQEERDSIDCLVNNAGVGVFKCIEELTEEEINQMIDINLKGTIYCTQEVLTGMREKNKGTIVNIVSGSGKVAKPTESVYSASKFGVRGFSDALALEVEDSKINIFSAYMGNMKTNLWRNDLENKNLDLYMDPEDVAEIIIENLKPRKHLNVSDITILNHN
ncbi:SDR family oxidoreductase [Alkalihalobacillus sp. MEB130]|uniref:SDR family oxidoreductase n=1 Tax=Alkalihalobacillus sp. MEB130 TaxID=2976704 RepID=UPI0028DF3FCF|nr:SDR family oxidoreductase [Alkalihalobacillus sp. MEB130]MDT8860687.1 SDR family oxidoreductase [Alkalihalobacillus sp. MEB130]